MIGEESGIPSMYSTSQNQTIMKKMISFLMIFMAAMTNDSFCQNPVPETSIRNGQTVYEAYCLSCHMADGNGLEGVFPSLVKTGNLTDKNKLVKIMLQGMRGPIMVNGTKYDGEMAGITLSDQEVADVINYIRNSWGNKAPLLKISDVAAGKKAVVKGYQPY